MAVSDVGCCDFYQVHESVVEAVNDKIPGGDKLYDLAEIFEVFRDSTRVKVLYILFEAGMCVCDIAQLLNMNQSAIPHQLRILKQNRLVKSHRDGEAVFYLLVNSRMRTIINQGTEYIEEQTLRQMPIARGWDMECE